MIPTGTIAKEIAAEGEMCRHIMGFGLPEDENEKLDDKVTEIFKQLGAVRPVTVSLSSSNIVQQILAKSRNLRRTEKFKSVFLSPDQGTRDPVEGKGFT